MKQQSMLLRGGLDSMVVVGRGGEGGLAQLEQVRLVSEGTAGCPEATVQLLQALGVRQHITGHAPGGAGSCCAAPPPL